MKRKRGACLAEILLANMRKVKAEDLESLSQNEGGKWEVRPQEESSRMTINCEWYRRRYELHVPLSFPPGLYTCPCLLTGIVMWAPQPSGMVYFSSPPGFARTGFEARKNCLKASCP